MQNLYSKLVILLSLFALECTSCFGKLELTQGVYGMPIVLTVSGQKNDLDNKLSTQLSTLVSRNLALTGELKVINGDSYLPTLDVIADYQKNGITYVAFAKLENQSFGSDYNLTLIFYDLMNDKNLDFTRPKKIFKYRFSSSEIEEFGNVLADDIYESITNVKGVFSTKLAYVMLKKKYGMKPQYDLKISNFDGAHTKTILTSNEPIMSPSWSHDGKKMAYVSFEENRSAIFIHDIESGSREKISDINGVNSSPSWSHDDKKLALVLADSGFTKIYEYEIESKKRRQLTFGNSLDTEPVWAADDKFLYFTSNRGGRPQIYRYDYPSSNSDRVTFKGDYNACPDISNDSNYLTFLHREGGLYF